MMRHAWAGQPAPALYAEWVYIRELGLTWPELHGSELTIEEVSLLAELVSIERDANAMRARTIAPHGRMGIR